MKLKKSDINSVTCREDRYYLLTDIDEITYELATITKEGFCGKAYVVHCLTTKFTKGNSYPGCGRLELLAVIEKWASFPSRNVEVYETLEEFAKAILQHTKVRKWKKQKNAK